LRAPEAIVAGVEQLAVRFELIEQEPQHLLATLAVHRRALPPHSRERLVAMIRSLRYLPQVSTNAKVDFEIEVPGDLARLHLPEGLDRRLQTLLDKQDGGTALSADEQAEAEGLVDLADLLTLLRLRSSKSQPAPG
jgi:hypothetical protein